MKKFKSVPFVFNGEKFKSAPAKGLCEGCALREVVRHDNYKACFASSVAVNCLYEPVIFVVDKGNIFTRIYNALVAIFCAPDVRDRYDVAERSEPKTKPPMERGEVVEMPGDARTIGVVPCFKKRSGLFKVVNT